VREPLYALSQQKVNVDSEYYLSHPMQTRLGSEAATQDVDLDGADLPHAELPGPSTKPALVVFGIALVLFLAIGLDLWLSGNQSTPETPVASPSVSGAGLPATPAASALKPIIQDDQPPPDVISALVIPTGTHVVPGSELNQAVDDYDSSISFTISVSEQDVITFYDAELKADGWKILSKGAATHSNGIQLIATHPSGDGYYWELGILVDPTQFSGSSSATESTTFTMRIYEVTDNDT
jgi:hypothetical protein